jgi:prepilin-type N-terminal cleavage/methylation domain-containing protein
MNKTMKTNPKNHRGFTLVELLVVIVIIAALAGLTAPMVIRQRKKADLAEATSNSKQIGLALFQFDQDYGTFPDSTTGTTVTENTGSPLAFGGNTSNDYFRQLIAAGIADSEAMFYAKTGFTKKPDNVLNTTEKALAKGEVGYGYIMNSGNTAISSSGNSARPIIAAPLAYPFQTGQFDVDLYDLKAIVLRLDQSAQALSINKQTKLAQVGGGKTLLQQGDDTVWGTGSQPTMVNPDPKG